MAERLRSKRGSEGPLSLGEALRTWCDPALTSEFLRMETHGPYEYVVLNPGESPSRIQKLDDFVRIRRKLEAEAHGCLRDGVWVADAFNRHMPVDKPRKTVLADWWRVLKPDFDAGTATGGGVEVFGIVVWRRTCGSAPSSSPAEGASLAEPALRIDKRSKRVRLNGHDLKLSPRSFKLLLMLAEAASAGTAPAQKRDLEAGVLGSNKGEKALAGAMYLLQREIGQAPSPDPLSPDLIENHRSVGYRLTLLASEIHIEG
jgi:hypothetical protein